MGGVRINTGALPPPGDKEARHQDHCRTDGHTRNQDGATVSGKQAVVGIIRRWVPVIRADRVALRHYLYLDLVILYLVTVSVLVKIGKVGILGTDGTVTEAWR